MIRDLASRLVVGLAGTWPTVFEAAWLKKWQPAGVILFSRNVSGCNELQGLCGVLHELVPGLEIMADHEGGPVSQLAGALGRPPCAWGLGVLDDAGLTARVFAQTGRRSRAVGIDRILAPVADVLTEIRNPVIGARSFGAQAAVVGRHTVAAVTGLLESDVNVCLKHWPGHGGSSGDSHLQETEVGRGAVDTPFTSGLTAGADAVMIGHLLVGRGGTAGSDLPATLDREYLKDSRRNLEAGRVEHLLFFADDITMGALGPAMSRLGVTPPEIQPTGLFDPGSLPVAWFEQLALAGCDRLLIRGIPGTAFPVDGSPDRTAASGLKPVPAPDFSPEPEFPAGPYEETRQRLWSLVGSDFADDEADLLWLDYSRADRWGAAAGQDSGRGGPLEKIQVLLSRMFNSVSTTPGALPGGRPCTRLVVSSHRPLPVSEDPTRGLASGGVCLVLGHPSLKTDLEGRLGSRWKVAALYDIAPEDLISGLQGQEH